MRLKSVSEQNQAARQERLGRPLCTPAWEDKKITFAKYGGKDWFSSHCSGAQEEGQAVTSQVPSIFNF